MENYLVEAGLPALFILSFLAATIIPIGSEWLLVVLILNGKSVEMVVIVATIGNYLGASTTYLIGLWGSEFLTQKILRVKKSAQSRAENFYKKYGAWSLLLSWLPIIGDPLCLIGGGLRLHFGIFSVFVFVGKLARYTIIAQVTAATIM